MDLASFTALFLQKYQQIIVHQKKTFLLPPPHPPSPSPTHTKDKVYVFTRVRVIQGISWIRFHLYFHMYLWRNNVLLVHWRMVRWALLGKGSYGDLRTGSFFLYFLYKITIKHVIMRVISNLKKSLFLTAFMTTNWSKLLKRTNAAWWH